MVIFALSWEEVQSGERRRAANKDALAAELATTKESRQEDDSNARRAFGGLPLSARERFFPTIIDRAQITGKMLPG